MAFDHLSVQLDWVQQDDNGNVLAACASFYKVDLAGVSYTPKGASAPLTTPSCVVVDRVTYIPATAATLATMKAAFNSQLASENAKTGVGASAINFILLK
jgi:hypothetical protein